MGAKGEINYDFVPIKIGFENFVNSCGYDCMDGAIHFREQFLAMYSPRRDGEKGIVVFTSQDKFIAGWYLAMTKVDGERFQHGLSDVITLLHQRSGLEEKAIRHSPK